MRFIFFLLAFLALGFAQGASIHATLEFTQPGQLEEEGYETLEGSVQMNWALSTKRLRVLTPINGSAVIVELINPVATVNYSGEYVLEGVQDRACTQTVREYAQYIKPYEPPYNETIRLLLFQNGSYTLDGIFVADITSEARETCDGEWTQDEILQEQRVFEIQGEGMYSLESNVLEGGVTYPNTAGFGALEPSNNWQLEWKFELERAVQEIVPETTGTNATITPTLPEEAPPSENNLRLVLIGIAILVILGYFYLQRKEEL